MVEQNTHLIKGRRYLKFFLLFIAVGLLVCSALFYNTLQIGIILPVFIAVLILLSISFPSMTLQEEGILIERQSLFRFLCSSEIIAYKTIKSIELEKGEDTIASAKTHWFYRENGFGPRSRGDRVILFLNDGNIRIIQRMGHKEHYYTFIETLKKKISS